MFIWTFSSVNATLLKTAWFTLVNMLARKRNALDRYCNNHGYHHGQAVWFVLDFLRKRKTLRLLAADDAEQAKSTPVQQTNRCEFGFVHTSLFRSSLLVPLSLTMQDRTATD